MPKLARLLVDQAALQPEQSNLSAIAQWLPLAKKHLLSGEDVRRIESYVGDGKSLHDLLPAVMPLSAPMWYEIEITAQKGTPMILGYGAAPAGQGGIDVWFAATTAHPQERIAGPLGPMYMDCDGVRLKTPSNDEVDKTLLAAAGGTVVRALMLGIGKDAQTDAESEE